MDNVFYVNFPNTSDLSPQKVYVPFERISCVFIKCLGDDQADMEASKLMITAKSIRIGEFRFKTLGLLLYLLSLPVIESVPDRILRYINVNNITFRPLSVGEFRAGVKDLESKRPNFKLNNSVVFIDELVEAEKVRLLRNICRAVDFPVVLSGTTAKVQNLICTKDAVISRLGPSTPWVQVLTTLPKANIGILAEFVTFEHASDGLHQTLSMYLDASRTDLNYQALKVALFGEIELNAGDWTFLESLFKLTVKQARTNLPGISLLSLNFLIKEVITLRGGTEGTIDKLRFWTSLLSNIQREVLKRKKDIDSEVGHISSAHILTFPSLFKKSHEVGALAGQKVDSHLFFFGLPDDDQIFRLSISSDSRKCPEFSRNDSEEAWLDYCHFPLFKNDLFSHMIAWNSWFILPRIGTLASLYQKYKNSKNEFQVHSDAKVTDGFQLEILSHWAACYASHVSIKGQASGAEFTDEFMKNLQVSLLDKSYKAVFPSSLESFLKRVSVPYLIGPDSFDEGFNASISQFIKIGKSYRPVNKVGWDVVFDCTIDGIPAKSLIECKLWARSVDISLCFKYYERAWKLGCPVSFLVVKSFQGSLSKKFDALTEAEVQAEIEARLQREKEERNMNPSIKDDEIENLNISANVDEVDLTDESIAAAATSPAASMAPEQTTVAATDTDLTCAQSGIEASNEVETKKVKLDDKKPPASIADFKKLFNQQLEKRINIYTAKLHDGRFVLEALKEFDDPTGVFIILQSTFNPDLRSSYS